MITCAIVDEDDISRLALETLIERVPFLVHNGSFTGAAEAYYKLQNNPTDLIFVDAQMLEFSELDLICAMAKRPEIIIISSKEKYETGALKVEINDFLLKPISVDHFLKTMNRMASKFASAPMLSQGSILVKANNQLINLSLSAINYIEAYGDYVNIYTEKARYIVHGTMKGMEAKLPVDEFVRVHRSHIVRIDKINAIEEAIIVIGKKMIPIGDSYRNLLMNHLGTHDS